MGTGGDDSSSGPVPGLTRPSSQLQFEHSKSKMLLIPSFLPRLLS